MTGRHGDPGPKGRHAPTRGSTSRPSPAELGAAAERGSATVVMLAVIAVVLTLTVSVLMLTSAVLASHRARAAADLAALAAAGMLIRGDPPGAACACAGRVAAANHGRVQRCQAIGLEVRLSVAVPAGFKGLGIATATSRAGPDPGT